MSFCQLYDLRLWPSLELTLCYYCAHAGHSVSHSTIPVYLAAIWHHHLQLGYTDALVHCPLLQYLCKGIKRHQGIRVRTRLPLPATLLTQLQNPPTQTSDFPRLDKMAIWAALCLGFHVLLAAEFTTHTNHDYSPTQRLQKIDIRLHRNRLTPTIKASKTDPFRATCRLTVAATGTSTCPIQAIKKFICHFTLSSGELVTRARFTIIPRKLFQDTGLSLRQARQYGSHSLKIGAATNAAAAGLPSWLI